MTREGNEEEDKRRIASEAFGDRDDTISKGKTNPPQGRPRALSEGSYFDQNRRDLEGSYRGSFDSAETDSTIDEDDFLDESNLSPNEQALLESINQLKATHQGQDITTISLVQNKITKLFDTAESKDEKVRLTKLLLDSNTDLPSEMVQSILEKISTGMNHHGPDRVTASENLATHAPSLQITNPKLDEAFKKALEEKFKGNPAVVEPILKLLAASTPQESKAAAKEVRRNAGENEKQVSEVYHKVFEVCKERGGSNIAHSQLEGADLKIEIDGVKVTCQPDPSGKHKFQVPNNALSKPIMIRCNQTGTILVLAPPNGQAVEVILPVGKTLENIKVQCMFDVDHYNKEAGKSQTTAAAFTATALQSHEQHGGNLTPPHTDRSQDSPRQRSNSI